MNIKLDRSKSYGEIIGSTDGSKYDQNGMIFDIDGNLLSEIPEQIIEIVEPKKLGRPRKEV